MKDQRHTLTKQMLKTINFHKNEMMKRASPDAFVSPDTKAPGLFYITNTFKELAENERKETLFKQKTAFQIVEPKELLEIAYQRNKMFYKHILNQTVPSNHRQNRKKDYPVALSFVDLAGSKENHHAYFKMPHVHSLFIVPQKTLPRFNSLISADFRLMPKTKKTMSIKTIDCQEMGWDWKDIYTVIDYSAKTYLQCPVRHYYPKEVQSLFFEMHG